MAQFQTNNLIPGGHAACVTIDWVLLEIWDALEVVGDHGQRVAGSDKKSSGT
jgi:hypothetical protein